MRRAEAVRGSFRRLYYALLAAHRLLRTEPRKPVIVKPSRPAAPVLFRGWN